jgi:ABC-2 type transport system permease protein
VSAIISEAVKDGSIAYILNKPYNFLLYHYSTAMGETLFRAVINALLGGAMIWWLVGPPPDPRGWPFVALAMVGAWTLHLCFSALIGLAAFIVEDVSAFQWVYQKMAFILGGLLIPLDLYPGWLQAIAKALPFASMTYGPARLFVEPAPSAILSTLGLQAVWIVIVGSVLALAYQRGMAYLAVNGG